MEDDIVWAWTGGERVRTPWKRLQDVTTAFPSAGLMQINRGLLLRPEAVLGFRNLPGGRMEVRVRGLCLEVSRRHAETLKQHLEERLAGQSKPRDFS